MKLLMSAARDWSGSANLDPHNPPYVPSSPSFAASHCFTSHNGIRSLPDALGLWTLCDFGHEVHGSSRFFLVLAAVCREGVNTTGLPGA